MPRSRLPPTPSSSTDLVAKDQILAAGMESIFSLPPPAINSVLKKDTTKPMSNRRETGQSSPPPSPANRELEAVHQRKRTLSGAKKSRSQPMSPTIQGSDTTLPPPPSRARKIIQMKPKQSHNTQSEESSLVVTKPVPTSKDTVTTSSATARGKRAQPSTTSAAGRKIARKTAHSIIERRRRSKMNEEFGVLKDMIPACAGVEMHKLAILQAGIEYLRYLEGCVRQLQSQTEALSAREPMSDQHNIADKDDEHAELMDFEGEIRENHQGVEIASATSSVSDISSPATAAAAAPPSTRYQQPLPSFRHSSIATSTSNSTHASPDLRPIHSSSSLSSSNRYLTNTQMRPPTSVTYSQSVYTTTPPPLTTQTQMPTGVSPAFGAIQFSPDLSRTSTWSSVNSYAIQTNPSPNILPLPQSAMPLSNYLQPGLHGGATVGSQQRVENHDGSAEATATAALMMMTRDRRNSSELTRAIPGKGISVKDLLSS